MIAPSHLATICALDADDLLRDYEDALLTAAEYPEGGLAASLDRTEDRLRSRWPADCQNAPLPDWAKCQIASEL